MSATYVVTGGAGFIGSNLVEAVLGAGENVRVIDDFSTGRRENLAGAGEWAAAGGGRFELIEGDIRDRGICARAMVGVDFVLHQAAIPSVQRSIEDPLASHSVNVDGSLNLLLAARDAGVKRFVMASSSSVYGESETLPKEESMQPDPISPYGLQKLTAETYGRLFHRLFGLPTIALRYFNVFGPRQDPSSDYAAVVPRFIAAAKNGVPPVVYGDGEQTRDFTFVGNVVQANLQACRANAEAFGEAFNVGCCARISLNDLLGLLRDEFVRRDLGTRYAEPRAGDIRHSLAAIEKAERLLGYRPAIDLRSGIGTTWEAM